MLTIEPTAQNINHLIKTMLAQALRTAASAQVRDEPKTQILGWAEEVEAKGDAEAAMKAVVLTSTMLPVDPFHPSPSYLRAANAIAEELVQASQHLNRGDKRLAGFSLNLAIEDAVDLAGNATPLGQTFSSEAFEQALAAGLPQA